MIKKEREVINIYIYREKYISTFRYVIYLLIIFQLSFNYLSIIFQSSLRSNVGKNNLKNLYYYIINILYLHISILNIIK
jgi:hypothetical protein